MPIPIDSVCHYHTQYVSLPHAICVTTTHYMSPLYTTKHGRHQTHYSLNRRPPRRRMSLPRITTTHHISPPYNTNNRECAPYHPQHKDHTPMFIPTRHVTTARHYHLARVTTTQHNHISLPHERKRTEETPTHIHIQMVKQ